MFSLPSSTVFYSLSERFLAARSRLLPWATQATLAFVDQLLNSGSNFAVSILLARWLQAEQYGAYALAFSIFLLFVAAQQALLIEPMTVFGPSSYAGHLREYLGALLWINGTLGLVCAAVLGLSALIIHHFAVPGGLASALAGLSVAAPFVLLFQVGRQAFYLEQRPAAAASGTLVYSLLLLGGMWVVYRRGLVSPFAAYLMMALAAAGAAAFILVRLRPLLKPGGNPGLRHVWREHWQYSRWVLGTGAVKWITGNFSYALTGTLLGMADTGALKALLNFFLPLSHTASSFSLVFQPYVSGIFGRQGRSSTKTPVRRVTLVFLSGGILYLALLMLFKKTIFLLLYGGKFMPFLPLLPWVAVSAVLSVASYGPAIGLRAIRSPSSILAAYSAAGATSILLGIVATWKLGLAGSVGALVLSNLALVIVVTFLFRRKVSRGAERPSTSEEAVEFSQ